MCTIRYSDGKVEDEVEPAPEIFSFVWEGNETVDDDSGDDESDEESISSSDDELIDLRDSDDNDGWKQHIHLLMNK